MTTRRTRNRCRRACRGERRGFTLIELLVAIIAGLMVAAVAFAFSKSATRFFSQEARIASAQMTVQNGFQRLQADIARASFLSTPNMRRDYDFHRVCAPNFDTWPTTLKTLTGLQIFRSDGVNTGARQLPDGAYPDRIRIAGSFASTDMFPVASVEAGVQGSIVTLNIDNGPIARAGLTEGNNARMNDIFKPGRILRILDTDGVQEFSVITEATWNTGSLPTIKTRDVIPIKGVDDPLCGCSGMGIGTQASVISIVEYAIIYAKSLSGGNADIYKGTIFSEAGAAYGDDTRTELVRREILVSEQDPPAIQLDNNVEIVAEYAVDLRFGLWVGSGSGVGLTYVAPGDIDTWMTIANAYTEGTAPSGPEAVRAVEARLVVRSREVDRTEAIGSTADGGYIHRFTLPDDAGVARARTLVANVSLPNQRGETWQ